MAGPDHRSLAWTVLDSVRTRKSLATAALRYVTERQNPAPEVVSATHRLVMGTLRERGYLDAILARLVERKLPRKDKRLMDLLRLALYEMLFMDSIPSYATGSRYVELVRRSKGTRVAGFVNALLRKAARLDPSHEIETRGSLPAHQRLSLPEWLLKAARATFGESAEEELAGLARPADIALRTAGELLRADLIDELKREGLSPRPMVENSRGLSLPPGESPYQTLAFARGRFRPQDRASQLVTDLVIAAGSGDLLDGCAGNGTKAIAMAEAGSFKSIAAADLSAHKLDELKARTTLPIETITTDLTDPDLPPNSFHTVLLDAPCTGLGTLRRHPELKWRRKAADGKSNGKLQAALLNGVAPLVKPGGLLIYAVCSFLPAEGPQVVDQFLANHSEFTLEPPGQHLDGLAKELTGRLAAANRTLPLHRPGMLLTLSSVLDGDLFLVALLRRDGPE
jgi:16S rRNA (cytosine967-C5)-methyltransferase